MQEEIINTYGLTEKLAKIKEHTILKDVQSISYIFKLRAGIKPHNIHEAKNIFITTNSRLTYASKKFEKTIYRDGSYFPITATDIFIGTLIWLRKPEKMVKESKKRLLSNVFAVLKPSDELFKRFIKEIQKLRNNKDISEDDYILLRDSQTAKSLLTEETLGDINAFTPKTPLDILDEIKEEAERKLSIEQEEHERTKTRLEDEKKEVLLEGKLKLVKEKEDHKKLRKKLEDEKRNIQEENNRKLIIEKEKHEELRKKLEDEKRNIQEENNRKLIIAKEKHEKLRKKLEDEKRNIQKESNRKLTMEKENHEKLRKKHENEKITNKKESNRKLTIEREEHEKTKQRIGKVDERVNSIATIIAFSIIGLCILIFALSFFSLDGWMKIVSLIISVLFFILSIVGITIKQIKNKFMELIKKLIGLK